MKCDDPECVQCYPGAAESEKNFWRVVIYVMIALLALMAVISYRYAPVGNGSDKSYGSNGSNAMEKSK